jgi:hypothetical protein
MSRRLLLLPLLSALFWGACRDPFLSRDLTGAERDARGALCAFAFGCAALIAASEIEKRTRQS